MRFPTPYPADRLAIPPADSPLIEQLLREEALDADQRERLRHFADTGYLVFDLELDDFDARAERVISNLAPRYPEKGRRIMEAWTFDEDVLEIARAPRALEVLRELFQREAIPFQTLNFDHGTEQPAHSDTVHFHCVPRRYMAGVWVALEDIDGDCGPLVVWPGSHRLPDLDMFDLGLTSDPEDYTKYEHAVHSILSASGIEPLELHPKRGQAVVWAANLFHGGAAQRDPARTRHSQVTHFYFADCLYYFPMSSDPFARRMCMREVIDLRTLRFVPHTYRGQPIDLRDYHLVVSYERPLPSFVDGASHPEAQRAEGEVDDAARQDVLELQVALRAQGDQVARLEREKQLLERQLGGSWSNLPFRLARGVRKTLSGLRNGPDART